MQKEDIQKKFKHLFDTLSSNDFLRMEALGGEIPFFISAYNPEQQLEVDRAMEGLKRKLKNAGIEVLEINLYDLILNLLEEELGEDMVFELERDMSKNDFLDALKSTLHIDEVLMPAIARKIEESDAQLYFLTGIGLAYPIVRSHIILNNLQSVAVDAPTVTFYPGIYNGKYLELFGKLKNRNYYRAFKIENYQQSI